MIERLHLTDFQCHESLKIPLDRITTLVGSSDVGKSAVLRALRWVIENRPAGAAFVRDGAKTAKVAVRVDGQWVVRARSDRENVYEFNGEVYQSLKAASAPPAVAELFNTGPVTWQMQLDPPFWLSDTAGEVGKNLNAVINLGEIDEVMARAGAAIRALRARETLCEERHAAARATAASLEWTAAAGAELDELETARDEWANAAALRDGLRDATGQEIAAAGRLAALDAIVADGDAVVGVGTELAAVITSRRDLARILDEYAAHERILAVDPSADWDELAAVRAAADAAAEESRGLRLLLEDLDTAERGATRCERELGAAEEQLERETGGVCPTCGQPATAAQLQSSQAIGTCPTESPPHAGRQAVRRGTPPKKGI